MDIQCSYPELLFDYFNNTLSAKQETKLQEYLATDEGKKLFWEMAEEEALYRDVFGEIAGAGAFEKAYSASAVPFHAEADSLRKMFSLSGLIRDAFILFILKQVHVRNTIRRIPWWSVSVTAHVLILLAATVWMLHAPAESGVNTMFRMNVAHAQRSEYKHRPVIGLRQGYPLIVPAVPEIDSMELFEEDIFECTTPEDLQRRHISQQLAEGLSIADLSGHVKFSSAGKTEYFIGAFRARMRKDRRQAIGRFGGSAATESAVLAALRWFKRHQAPEGSWSFREYFNQCKGNPGCSHYTDGWERRDNHIANEKNGATGFALLCFLGAGHTHRAGRFRQQVAEGISFISKNREPDGSFSEANYVHAITTMAVSEAYGMTRSAKLKDMAQKGIDVLLSRQNDYMGWDYSKATGRNDTSVSGWCVAALKSAKSAGLDIGDSFRGVAQYLNRITPAVQGKDKPVLADHCKYEYLSRKGAPSMHGHRNAALTAVALLSRIYIGEDTNSELLRAHANLLLKHLPEVIDPANTVSWWHSACYYQWYYSTLAMFQMGGSYWKRWNEALKRSLLELQSKGGCADGSWDPVTHTASRAGRVYATAVNCLSLEVYYRYLPVSMLK